MNSCKSRMENFCILSTQISQLTFCSICLIICLCPCLSLSHTHAHIHTHEHMCTHTHWFFFHPSIQVWVAGTGPITPKHFSIYLLNKRYPLIGPQCTHRNQAIDTDFLLMYYSEISLKFYPFAQ